MAVYAMVNFSEAQQPHVSLPNFAVAFVVEVDYSQSWFCYSCVVAILHYCTPSIPITITITITITSTLTIATVITISTIT